MADDPTLMALPGITQPSAVLAEGKNAKDRPELAHAHLIYDAAPRWPGAWLLATNGFSAVVLEMQHLSGVRVPPGPVGRMALKLMERYRKFTGTDTRLEPVGAPERVVMMRTAGSEADDAVVQKIGDSWPAPPLDGQRLEVAIDANRLAAVVAALGPADGHVVLTFDLSRMANDAYPAPIAVRAAEPPQQRAEALLMPLKLPPKQ